jgi:hypothetical protein
MFWKSNHRRTPFATPATRQEHRKLLAALIIVACWQTTVHAAGDKKDTPTPTVCDPRTELNCVEGPDAFRGLKWGLGVAYSSSLGGVGTATIDQTTHVVHITKQNVGAACGVFELHYFFKFCNDLRGRGFYCPDLWVRESGTFQCQNNTSKKAYQADPQIDLGDDTQFGMGPFVSLNTSPFDTSGNSGNGKVFDSVGMGWMIGLNAYDQQQNLRVLHSLNFGVGLIIDTAVRTLVPGVSDGQFTTFTQDGQLTRQVTRTGWMMLLSYKLFDFTLQ